MLKIPTAVDIKKIEQSLHHEKNKEYQDFDRWYGAITYILFFFSFSVLGYIWEVALHFVQTGELVKRGVLSGPWLPIYGSGGVIVLLLLRKLFKNPILTFTLTMVIASIIEYYTSLVLEIINGVRWWDYSGYFMNINGRICLEGTVVFGIGGCLIVYILAPRLAKIFDKVKLNIRVLLCIILIIFFMIDFIYSIKNPNMGRGVTAKQMIDTLITNIPERIMPL